MENISNLRIYRCWAPVYDLIFQPVMAEPRRKLVELLQPQAHERWLIPGVGTGQDLAYLSRGLMVVAGDLSPEMLEKAIARSAASNVAFHRLDAQSLPFPDATFEGVLLNLILSVVPDGSLAFREAWRVLKPGGRIGIFDKFAPETHSFSPLRKMIGFLMRQVGTDPNRRLSDLIADAPDLEMRARLPVLLGGQYQLIVLYKGHGTLWVDARRTCVF